MSFQEMICFAKLFSQAFTFGKGVSMSNVELEVASETLKNMADSRDDWTQEEKDIYSMMVDIAKELTSK